VLAFASPRLQAPRAEIAAALEGKISPEPCFTLQRIVRHIAFLEDDIAAFNARLLAGLDSREEKNALALLETVPGIDLIGAAMLLVEIGSNNGAVRRRRPPGVVGGHVPRQQQEREQAQERAPAQGQHLRAPPPLRVRASCQEEPLRLPGQAQRAGDRRSLKRAIMTCAHKMVRVIWAMLLSKEPYRHATVDCEALGVRRNAPRWIRELKRFGYLRASAATR
jgi:transposase